jgi:NTE family protein
VSTALVFGGGGVTGIAWETGLLAGLAELGVDFSHVDKVIGTSAGSVVAAQLLSTTPLQTLYEDQLSGKVPEIPARIALRLYATPGLGHLRRQDERGYLARLGELALAAETVPEAERRAVIEARLPEAHWPDKDLRITASDAETGVFTVFTKDSGVPLADAVTASCAVPGTWPPATVGGRRYIDGGMRSIANADLAADFDRVLVIAPSMTGLGPVIGLPKQLRELEDAGSLVSLVTMDDAALHTVGRDPLDPSRRAPVARAGFAQAMAAAALFTA